MCFLLRGQVQEHRFLIVRRLLIYQLLYLWLQMNQIGVFSWEILTQNYRFEIFRLDLSLRALKLRTQNFSLKVRQVSPHLHLLS